MEETGRDGGAAGTAGPGVGSAPASAPRVRRGRAVWRRPAGRSRRLQAALGRLGFWLGSKLPFSVSYAVGGALGALAYCVPGRTRHVTRVNLRLCFPELSDRERARLGRRATAETGRLAFELGGIWHWPRERTLSLVRDVEGRELLDAVLARGRGAILLTPHIGSWELCGLWVSATFGITSLYKPPRIRELDAYYKARRERFGASLVPAGPSGVSALVRALRRNGVVGILPDQDPGPGSGVFSPLLGVPANTSVLVPRLAQRTGAGVLCVTCERLPGARGFRLRISPTSVALGAPDLDVATCAMNADLGTLIRRAPEQYLWSYKRFRVRPEGMTDPYRS